MAITRVADITFTAAASTTTGILKSAAAFGSVVVGDRVYNTTRSAYSRVLVKTDSSTLSISPSIAGQTTGDNITISPAIQITGNYSSGTASGVAATSLTDTSKSWTVDALARRSIRLKDGAYAGAIGYVSANTATVATVEQWTWFNTSTKAFEIVTPTGTPTYEVGQNWDDVVTALGSDVAWLSTVNKRHIRITGGSGLNLADATAFFSDVDITVELPPQGVITSGVNGNCWLFGKFNSSLIGVNGGEILLQHLQSYYLDMSMYGKFYVLGGLIKVNKPITISNYPRWNTALTSGTDGIILVDTVFKNGQILHQLPDISLRVTGEVQNLAIRSPGQSMSGVVMNNGNASISGKYTTTGIQGGDASYFKFSGSDTSGAAKRLLWADQNIMPYAVGYLHGFEMGTAFPTVSDWYYVISWAASIQYSLYFTIPVAITTLKAEDNTALGSVAVGVVKSSDGSGQIITAKGGTLNTTLTAGTTTTTMVTTGDGFADISVGAYCYNLTRQSTNIILTKPNNNTLTTAAITGQASGDVVNFSSRFAYAPTKKRFVVTDGSGAYASPLDASKGLIVSKYHLRNGGAQYVSAVVTDSPYTLYALRYGYYAASSPRDWTMKEGNAEGLSMVSNPFVVADEATALAYTGIAINGTAKTITVTGTRTVQEVYDYTQVWRYDEAVNNDVIYDEPLSTSDGTGFALASGWVMTVTGTLTSITKIIADKATDLVVGTGGFFEDAQGAIWESGGDLHYASHVYLEVRDTDTNDPVEGAVIGFGDETTQTKLGYTVALAQDTLVTDALGQAEGYFVYKIDSTTYAATKQVVGNYEHVISILPRSLTGLPIGSAAAHEVLRLTADTEVTLSKSEAAAITGITVDVPTDTIDLGGNTLSDAYDNLKYQVTADADIDTGVPACMYACLFGLPLRKTGTSYTARASGTVYQNLVVGANTWSGGIVEWDTPATITGTFGATTFRFTTAGTYDFADAGFIGAITLTNTSGGAVVVELPLGVTYTNSGPSITVIEPQTYQSVTLTGGVAGTRVQLYDLTAAEEVYNGVPASWPFVWEDSTPYVADREIRLRAMKVSGATAKEFVEATLGTATESTPALAYNIAQVDDAVYNANAINGSTVTTVTIDDTYLLVEVDSGAITWGEIYGFETYWLGTEEGIRDEGRFIEAADRANYRLHDFKIKNITSPSVPLTISGGYGVDADTGTVADIMDTSGGSIFPAPDHVVAFQYETIGSPVITGDIADLPTASENAAAVMAYEVEPAYTMEELVRLQSSVLLGKISGAGTGTETFRDVGDNMDRVIATVDEDGNRTAIVLDDSDV